MDQAPQPEPLRIQIASDLHIELYRSAIPDDIIIPNAPVLALLGDIGLACSNSLRSFLHQQADRFQHVLFLAGNHEFYNNRGRISLISEQMTWMRRVCAERDNLHFLERETIELNGVHICGATLWSNIPEESYTLAEKSLNDYIISYSSPPDERPRKLRAAETARWHKETVAWLEDELEEARKRNQPVLVLTHHTPKIAGTSDPVYDGNELSCCFSSDLGHLLKNPVKAWACGHTHYNFSMTAGSDGVRLVSNQRGYFHQVEKRYKPDGLVLEISSNL